jgi:hypothetical protein
MSPFNTRFGFIHTPVNIPPPDHHGNLYTQLSNRPDIPCIMRNNIRIETKTFIAHQGFAGEFEKDAFVFREHEGYLCGEDTGFDSSAPARNYLIIDIEPVRIMQEREFPADFEKLAFMKADREDILFIFF